MIAIGVIPLAIGIGTITLIVLAAGLKIARWADQLEADYQRADMWRPGGAP